MGEGGVSVTRLRRCGLGFYFGPRHGTRVREGGREEGGKEEEGRREGRGRVEGGKRREEGLGDKMGSEFSFLFSL
jgi:hypothetical protein